MLLPIAVICFLNQEMLRVFISNVHIELLFQICAIHVHRPAYRRQWSKNTRRSRPFTLAHWRKWRRNTKHFESWWVINSSRQILVAWTSPGCGVFLVVAKDDINRWDRDQNGFVSFNASFFVEEHFIFQLSTFKTRFKTYEVSRLAISADYTLEMTIKYISIPTDSLIMSTRALLFLIKKPSWSSSWMEPQCAL